MADIYNQDRPKLEGYLEHFRVVPSQVGTVFLINGKVVRMDCVDKSVTFEKLFKKLSEFGNVSPATGSSFLRSRGRSCWMSNTPFPSLLVLAKICAARACAIDESR